MHTSFDRSNVYDILELNAVQKGMLFHYLKEAGDNVYNAQICLRLEGDLHEDSLRQALRSVQSRNESLRSVFSWEKTGKPLQIILRDCPLDYRFHDLLSLPDADSAAFVCSTCLHDRHERFDLQTLPVRIRLFRTAATTFIFSITHHHILYDGWSGAILLHEIFVACRQTTPQYAAPDAKATLKQVNRGIARATDHEADRRFWKKYLTDAEPTWITRLFLKQETGTA